MAASKSQLKIRADRVIVHFDYDCFYAAVFEKEDPALRSLPLAVQQKQIIVTCNYEARRRGLYKLQLVKEAKSLCPDVIIMLGEDLTRFRNASKDNYEFLRKFLWSDRAERLGFDEVFMDISDMVDYSLDLLNYSDLETSFFHLDLQDPTTGFAYDATSIVGHTFPSLGDIASARFQGSKEVRSDLTRLRLGSHLANYLRKQLEEHKGFTATVGISTNKLTSKLVGNLNKPRGQTTLISSYVHNFMDGHDVGRIPGIGFKTAQMIREYILGRPAAFDSGLVYGGSKEDVKVRDVRTSEGMSPKLLEHIFSKAGFSHDLPERIWGYLNGIDESEVAKGRDVPQQISMEDSYIRLDELAQVEKELKMLARSLINRMRLDLTSRMTEDHEIEGTRAPSVNTLPPPSQLPPFRWLAHPRTLRLSTRPRPPLRSDGTRERNFARISKSSAMPSFVFNLSKSVEEICERLVSDVLMPLFRKIHPESCGWNLSLVNICATNMTLIADSSGKLRAGRDISHMLRRQDEVLKEWKIEDIDVVPVTDKPKTQMSRAVLAPDMPPDNRTSDLHIASQPEANVPHASEEIERALWCNSEEYHTNDEACRVCGSIMPVFAVAAHQRYHDFMTSAP